MQEKLKSNCRFVLAILVWGIIGTLTGPALTVERLETPMEDLNRIAGRHMGFPVQWGGFGVEFTATQVAFSRLKQSLIVTAFGRYSDLGKSETADAGEKTPDPVELELRLRYVIDTASLDPAIGITTADESQIIEVYCLVENNCITFQAWLDGRPIEPLTGMEPGLLAGFGRPNAGLTNGDSGPTLAESIVETVNAMRREAGLDAIVD